MILKLSISSSVGRGCQIHLQHSTQDVAQRCLPPAHQLGMAGVHCTQPRTSKVHASTLLNFTELHCPYHLVHRHEANYTEAEATYQAPRYILQLTGFEKLPRQR